MSLRALCPSTPPSALRPFVEHEGLLYGGDARARARSLPFVRRRCSAASSTSRSLGTLLFRVDARPQRAAAAFMASRSAASLFFTSRNCLAWS